MTKGRSAFPLSVVAEQNPFFITLGRPKAHNFSGRDDNPIAGQVFLAEAFAGTQNCHPDRSEA
jgi:hypothetical protein